MTDIPNTHTFKPDYLCDNPVCKEAMNELLTTIKEQSDEIAKRDRLAEDAHEYVLAQINQSLKAEIERLKGNR